MLRIPDEEHSCVFDILRTAPDDPVVLQHMLASNRALEGCARDLGSKHYTTSAVTLSQDDFRHHFSPAWNKVVRAKRRFDPDHLLTPGPGIFSSRRLKVSTTTLPDHPAGQGRCG
ncbi:MAG: hypothetical protein R2867_30720 [Caldilineaceae bacterium]